MHEVFSNIDSLAILGHILPAGWAYPALSYSVGLLVLNRLSGSPIGPFSLVLLILLMIPVWSSLSPYIFGKISLEASPSMIFKLFASFVALAVILFISMVEAALKQSRDDQKADGFVKKLPDLVKKNRVPAYSLYLRTFARTNNRATQPSMTAEEGDFLWNPHVDFETVLIKTFGRKERLLAIGKARSVGRIPRGLIPRVNTETNWQSTFVMLASHAKSIMVESSDGAGIFWEIEWLVTNDMLSRCIFMMPENAFRAGRFVTLTPFGVQFDFGRDPEETPVDFSTTWSRIAERITVLGLALPSYQEEGMLFRMKQDGCPSDCVSLNLATSIRRARRLRQLMAPLRRSKAD